MIDASVFHPIPGYEGLYWIDSAGNVLNRSEHYMKPMYTEKGPVVELRKNGQRERFFVKDLVTIVETLKELKSVGDTDE